ncbi:hypothetical protein [Dehalobacter sp. TBBPA1]|uniref:hypothetical protein n=1 Tax=Dehalobacter sp. TBBPA1 TaxID=3235037 RepID=UPI0034A4ED64
MPFQFPVDVNQKAGAVKVTVDGNNFFIPTVIYHPNGLTEVNNTNPLPITIIGSSPNLQTVIVLTGQSLSNEIVSKGQLLALDIDTNLTGAVTQMTFQGSMTSGGVYKNIYDDSGSEVAVAVAANRIVTIDLAALKLAAVPFLKIRFGTSASPVNATADRTIIVSSRG